MKAVKIIPKIRLRGTVVVPGDKSISHRAAIMAALARGKTRIRNFLFCDDCLVTLEALESLGVKVAYEENVSQVVIDSQGCLEPPKKILFMKESGTSARILLGLLAGQGFAVKMTGASSLMKRPMLRVIKPLRMMGARIKARKARGNEFLPLEVLPAKLSALHWTQEVPSAQVKSAILLAGLFANGKTMVGEPVVTRDHTERMLKYFGADIKTAGRKVYLSSSFLKTPGDILIPCDFSSAAFFIVAALLIKDSDIFIKNVGINPTRFGAFHVLKRMGARMDVFNHRSSYEPVADIRAVFSHLKSTVIKAREIPSLIDELPVLMIAAGMAEGKTVIEGAGELRVKETDRIRSLCFNLRKLGVKVNVLNSKDGERIEIHGVNIFKGAALKSFSDHRTAMSGYVAALAADSVSTLDGVGCINKSFPLFFEVMNKLFTV